jgi:hypothetical protein
MVASIKIFSSGNHFCSLVILVQKGLKMTRWIPLLLLTGIFCSCERNDPGQYTSISFWLGDPTCQECSENSDLLASADMIQFYDRSAHIVYLTRKLDVSTDSVNWYAYHHFTFTDQNKVLLKGTFTTIWSSLIPADPYILVPSPGIPDDMLQLNFSWLINDNDLRPFHAALLAIGKMRNGLTLNLLQIHHSGDSLTFSIRIKNIDEESLMLLDPEKCGEDVLFWFTPAPMLVCGNQAVYRSSDESPSDPGFNPAWFSLLRPGTSVTYKLSIDGYDLPVSGDYQCSVSFSGPCKPVDERFITTDGHQRRIWAGTVSTNKIEYLP